MPPDPHTSKMDPILLDINRVLTISSYVNKQIRLILLLLFSALILLPGDSFSRTFFLPANGDAVIGELDYVFTNAEDTLVDIARRYDLGYDEIRLANPNVDPWIPGENTRILIPSLYVLPDAPREGIVINLAERRLYYFPAGEVHDSLLKTVTTYPISIGREGWETPLGKTNIVRKDLDPTWFPPESIRKEKAAEGNPLPAAVPPGPDNPLGGHALRLGFNSYLIHGTNKPFGIGMQVSHGCIRMTPEDIESLFPRIALNTPVHIVDQSFKAGLNSNTIYLEVHPPSVRNKERLYEKNELSETLLKLINEMRDEKEIKLDWSEIRLTVEKASGVPTPLNIQIKDKPRGDYPPQAHPPLSLPDWTESK